jgi:hypothetical protein
MAAHYFSMELLSRGRTLAELLRERADLPCPSGEIML